MKLDNKYDYLDFELYTIDELKAEMREDLEAVDKTAQAALQDVVDWINSETDKKKALAKRTRQTTRHKSRKR